MRPSYLLARILLLPGLLLSAAPALAEDDVLTLSLEELSRLDISIATGTPKRLQQAPAVASVITAQDLETLGAQDIGAALETVPGLHVSHGGLSYGPRYFIRGIASLSNPHTLLLVNGVPQTSLYLGERGESLPLHYSLPVALIQRIEIIRGPGSAVYGADAFAGVINLITKSPGDTEGGKLRVSAGSFETGRAFLQQTGRLGTVPALVSLSYTQSEGDRPVIAADRQTGLDQALPFPAVSRAPGPVTLGLKVFQGHTELQGQDLRLRLDWMQAWDIGTGQGAGEVLDPDGQFSNRHAGAELSWRVPHLPATWALDTQLSYIHKDFETGDLRLFARGACFPAAPPNPPSCFPDGVISRSSVSQEQARASLNALYSGWEQHRLRLGSGFFWGDLYETTEWRNLTSSLTPRPGGLTDISDTSEVFLPEAQRTSAYGFIQEEWAFAPAWELTVGLRYDYYSDFGGTTNPRLALVWQTLPTLTSKLLYGEAFRAPAFFDLYSTSNRVARGNPELKPEKLRSLELALGWKPRASLAWDLNLYQFRIRDFIDFVSDPGQSTFTARNTDRFEGRGVETEVRYQASSSLQLLANFSHQRTENQANGEALGQAPSEEAHARAAWDFAPRWQFTPQLTWIGERKRQAGDPRSSLAGYTSLDLTLRKRWRRSADLALIVRNLADADIREPSREPGPGQTQPAIPNDLPQPGRSVMLEASASW